MSKTLFSNKCKIITELTEEYDGDPYYESMFAFWNLSVPFAIGAYRGLVILTSKGEEYVEAFWNHICNDIYHVDPLGEYESLEQFESISNIESDNE